MQGPGTAIRARGLDLLEDIRATLGFDLVRSLPNQRIAVKTRNLRFNSVFHVLNGGFDAHRVVRIEAGRNDVRKYVFGCLSVFDRTDVG